MYSNKNQQIQIMELQHGGMIAMLLRVKDC